MSSFHARFRVVLIPIIRRGSTIINTHAGPGGWNDADFIYTGGEGCADNKPFEHCPGQTDTEYHTEFSMWCIMGSSLLVATDIRNMTDIMKEVGQ